LTNRLKYTIDNSTTYENAIFTTADLKQKQEEGEEKLV